MIFMIIPLVSLLQRLTAQNFPTECNTAEKVFLNVLIASSVACQGLMIFLDLQLFFLMYLMT